MKHLQFKLTKTGETYGVSGYIEFDDIELFHENYTKTEALAILKAYTGKRRKIRAKKRDRHNRYVRRIEAKKEARFAAIAKAKQDASPFDPEEEYDISSWYLSALINGDYSSFDYYYDDEKKRDRAIKRFDDWVEGVQDGRQGHWSYYSEDSEDAEDREKAGEHCAYCEVTGKMSDCETVVFWPLKQRAD